MGVTDPFPTSCIIQVFQASSPQHVQPIFRRLGTLQAPPGPVTRDERLEQEPIAGEDRRKNSQKCLQGNTKLFATFLVCFILGRLGLGSGLNAKPLIPNWNATPAGTVAYLIFQGGNKARMRTGEASIDVGCFG